MKAKSSRATFISWGIHNVLKESSKVIIIKW